MEKDKLMKMRSVIKLLDLFEEYENIIELGDIVEVKFLNKKTGRTHGIKKVDMLKNFDKYMNEKTKDLFNSIQGDFSEYILEAMMKITEEFKNIK